MYNHFYGVWDVLRTQQILDIITITIVKTVALFQFPSSRMMLGVQQVFSKNIC